MRKLNLEVGSEAEPSKEKTKHGLFESVVRKFSGCKTLTPSKIAALNAPLSDLYISDSDNDADIILEPGDESEVESVRPRSRDTVRLRVASSVGDGGDGNERERSDISTSSESEMVANHFLPHVGP